MTKEEFIKEKVKSYNPFIQAALECAFRELLNEYDRLLKSGKLK